MSVFWGDTDIETTATTHFKIIYVSKKKSEDIFNNILNFSIKRKDLQLNFFKFQIC